MTKELLRNEALKPSTAWVEAGQGDLGKLYFEIIGCDGLPNMDMMTLDPTSKTDAFACLLFEDSIVTTDVIGNSLHPRWMPWSRRAFVFNISHPSSDVNLGIFDYDEDPTPFNLATKTTKNLKDQHDKIGRIVIELSNFLPDTEYTLTVCGTIFRKILSPTFFSPQPSTNYYSQYPIHRGELASDRRKAKGTVTVRFRIEWNNPREAMVRVVKTSQAPNIISVARSVDFEVARYTAQGEVIILEQNGKHQLTLIVTHIYRLF